jgi:hypothetical protein
VQEAFDRAADYAADGGADAGGEDDECQGELLLVGFVEVGDQTEGYTAAGC